ncbi:M3 family metallopeptidase [Streptomyces cyslabdanicus]|uniref:M3 family metallopeptidase n=1 Tax=Streptomyces cyslabdanicus TaxID=1470456 RepID=UPI004043FB6B
MAMRDDTAGIADNPFLAPSTLPYQLPPFAAIRTEHYLPAFEHGMAEQLAEIDAIAGAAEPPTFENTVVALERSGAVLDRVSKVFFNLVPSDGNAELEAIEAEISPRLAAHADAIHLNAGLFARLEDLYSRRDELGFDSESHRLLGRYHTRFVRAGARLTGAERDRLREINKQLAADASAFGQNVLADTNAAAPAMADADELDGLSADEVAAAAERADGSGGYVLALQNFSNQPLLATLNDREVRRRLLAASLGRGLETNAALVRRMARLRAERAALFGYESHAAYVVADRTARTPDAVADMLGRLVEPAVTNATREAEALTAALREDTGDPHAALHPADWRYYAERVRKAEYDVDSAALRPYLELDRVLFDGVFHAAGLVYGITLTERDDLVGYHPDVRVFEVSDADGRALGLFLADFFARPSKRGGAWMNELVSQSTLAGTQPVVVNNLNIARPPAGEPVLLTFDEVRTMFHEFGHALHGLFSDVSYPYFSGTAVPQDFVEFPSQVNEMWMVWPEVLANYARHRETGEPMPPELAERVLAAQRFGEGFRTVEYLGAALLDWAWHSLAVGADPGGVEDFEARALSAAGVAMDAVPPRYRTGYFQHIFSGNYSAGYYSYIWSEVLDADTVEWFKEDDGLTLREKGERFRHNLLARGGSVDALDAFRDVRGRAPDIAPLLARRGLGS